MAELLPFAKYALVDVRRTKASDWKPAASQLKGRGIKAIAARVDNGEVAAAALDAGFPLLQGFYFCRPTTFLAAQIPARRLAYIKLLSALNREDVSMFRRRAWAAIFVGALIANLTTDVPLLPATAIAIGNTLEAITGGWLLREFADVDRSLDRLRQVTALIILGALVSTTVSATIGALSLCAGGLQSWGSFPMEFGDALLTRFAHMR